MNTLIVGAGGVGSAVAFKCAQNNSVLGNITLASRTEEKCQNVIQRILKRAANEYPEYSLTAKKLDATNVGELVELIKDSKSGIVINAASTTCNMPILQACLEAGAHYLDSSVAEGEHEDNMPAPWYQNYEWRLKEDFKKRNLSAILSIGFDPGVVNVFAAYAQQHLFDEIDSIDILDVNAGNHGHFFATNFNPEINLREIAEDVQYWDGGAYRRIPCLTRIGAFDFPDIGLQKLYSVGHDELHSLPKFIRANRIEFWMGLSERYLRVFDVLKNIGLLSSNVIQIDEETALPPIKVLNSVLPDPSSLAEKYTGNACIGTLVKGFNGNKPRAVFIYSNFSHQDCYRDTESQAVSYSTAVPLVAAAVLIVKGDWAPGRMVNVEELDPIPFLNLMPELGITWNMREENVSDQILVSETVQPLI